jgi:methyl acetate hydrolase
VPPATLTKAAQAELDRLLQDAFKRRDVPNVVAVVANREEVLYRGAVGASITDIYRIASMSKPVTSVAIMMLRERGLLDLDDPVERYLPEFAGREVIQAYNAAEDSLVTRAAAGPFTLRHLLTHTAGFSYDFSNEIVLALCKDGRRTPRDLPLLYDPGSGWSYGCATGILGDVIERVTGEPFYTFCDREILQPLGMVETSHFIKPEDLPRLVPLHFRTNREWVRDLNTRPHEPFLSADGGLLGPAEEYIRFLQMLLNGGRLGDTRLLTEESVREMVTNQIGELTIPQQRSSKSRTALPFPLGANEDQFGLGFQIKMGSHPFSRSPGSFSWGGVFNTHFWADPHKGIAALLFTQLLPYYDEQVIRLLCDFEKCVYNNLV